MCKYFSYPNLHKIVKIHKESVSQLVEWQNRNLKKVGSSPPWCFWRCHCRIRRIRSGLNSRQLWRTQRQAERRAAWPGTVPSPPPPPSLLLSWRNTRSELLRPILFCIFGMCSPRRKSAATVRTVRKAEAMLILLCVRLSK